MLRRSILSEAARELKEKHKARRGSEETIASADQHSESMLLSASSPEMSPVVLSNLIDQKRVLQSAPVRKPPFVSKQHTACKSTSRLSSHRSSRFHLSKNVTGMVEIVGGVEKPDAAVTLELSKANYDLLKRLAKQEKELCYWRLAFSAIYPNKEDERVPPNMHVEG